MSLLTIVILYCSFVMGRYFWDSFQNYRLNNQLRNTFQSEDTLKQGGERNLFDFESLLQINPDVVGWVKIKDTKIDYPVLQAKDNNYYLNHNIHRKHAKAGSIFMDYRNKRDRTDKNTIIYGHHMKDGSMFKDLVKYKDKDFLKAHPIIELDTLKKITKWEIFSMYVTDTDFDYNRTYFAGDEEYEVLLREIQSRSIFKTDIEVTKEDKILTLSTCTYEFDNARFTVHGKLIE